MSNNEPVLAKDYVERYANNVTFFLQGTDITLIFGTRTNDSAPTQHTAITVAWAEAKLLLFLLGQNIALFEAINGEKVQIPSGIVPSPPQEPSAEKQQQDPNAMKVYQTMKASFDLFVASLY